MPWGIDCPIWATRTMRPQERSDLVEDLTIRARATGFGQRSGLAHRAARPPSGRRKIATGKRVSR
jgi:hypothetical protein